MAPLIFFGVTAVFPAVMVLFDARRLKAKGVQNRPALAALFYALGAAALTIPAATLVFIGTFALYGDAAGGSWADLGERLFRGGWPAVLGALLLAGGVIGEFVVPALFYFSQRAKWKSILEARGSTGYVEKPKN